MVPVRRVAPRQISSERRALDFNARQFHGRLLQAEWEQRRRQRFLVDRKREIRAYCVKKTQGNRVARSHMASISVIAG